MTGLTIEIPEGLSDGEILLLFAWIFPENMYRYIRNYVYKCREDKRNMRPKSFKIKDGILYQKNNKKFTVCKWEGKPIKAVCDADIMESII